jgi:hypothetical protein
MMTNVDDHELAPIETRWTVTSYLQLGLLNEHHAFQFTQHLAAHSLPGVSPG